MNPTPFVTPSIPPTGPYPVGLVRRFLFDPSRRNRFGISTNNSFFVTVWYPASPASGQKVAGYDPEQHANEIDGQGLMFMDRAPRFASYSILDAPLRSRTDGYPVVVNSHCRGCGGLDQENLAENLASHGYVTVAIDHADAPISLSPDGSVFRQGTPAGSVAGTLDRVKDLGFLVNELGRLNQEDSVLKGAFRLPSLAVMGWSWGADTIYEYSRLESRCLAAISLDGDADPTIVTAEALRSGLQKPSLTMNTTANAADVLFKLAVRDAYFTQITGTIHGDFGTYGWQLNPNLPSSQEAQRTIHAYVLSFLNKHLKGEDDHLLDGKSPAFPRVSTFKKK